MKIAQKQMKTLQPVSSAFRRRKKKVCKSFLLATLHIGENELNNLIRNIKYNGEPKKDLRGEDRKFSSSKRAEIHSFIKFPAMEPHYFRAKSTHTKKQP